MPLDSLPMFEHGDIGLTRFPPNVEQITVRCKSGTMWLVARRNDVELRFPLNVNDCRHLATLLMPDGLVGDRNSGRRTSAENVKVKR